jgi:hypothetical protein
MRSQMSFLATDPRERPDEDVRRIGELLCAEPVLGVERCAAGGNNRVYRIRTERSSYALKWYGSAEIDDRDRLGHEFGGLRFLADAGVLGALPLALAADRAAGCALYGWIEGERPTQHGITDIAALLGLLDAMHRARAFDGAANLPDATEATPKLGDVVEQIRSRLERLAPVAESERELALFLSAELEPELTRRLDRITGRDSMVALERGRQTLSPSDFGFHNALRRPDGTLAFIDFEYFGWDDPVKLTSDFLWHPAMALSEDERVRFLAGATKLYGEDPDYFERLAICYPLHGIRWCLIILNEFLPLMWERRVFSGNATGDWEAAKARQLAKARAVLSVVCRYKEGKIA